MPVALSNIRDLLLPGLQQIHQAQFAQMAQAYAITRKAIDDNLYNNLFADSVSTPTFTLEEIEQAEAFIEELNAK